MSRNGELCLKKIIISYSPSSGNPATRQFFAHYLPQFARKYPQVVIDIRPRMWPETCITGVYRDGSEKAYNIRYLSSMGINIRCHRLVNEGNDTNVPFTSNHMHFQRKSIQGCWNPWLWNFETARRRSFPAKWDRRLTEQEWDYYTKQYSAQMKVEEQVISNEVDQHTSIPDENTREVQERWKKFVLPRLQTDFTHNLRHWKQQHAKGAAPPAAAKFHEYKLFSVPNHTTMGQDAMDVLRRREARYVEEWWQQRKDQLKPPEQPVRI